MEKKILIINGPNINLLGEREQSQYGSTTLDTIKKECLDISKSLNVVVDFKQSNIEGEIVNIIQESRNSCDGLIINAAGFTHTSVSIRDSLNILKIPIIEVHISNIYKREEFRKKSLLSDIVTGGIFGVGSNCYILALRALHVILKNGSR